jgi:hypothetical protein
VILVDVQIKNNTHWGWKKGVFLGMDESNEISGMPIEIVHVPMDDFDVKAMENFTVTIPIQVVDNAFPSDQVFAFTLRFRGPHGSEFGEPIPLKLKVI